MDIIQSFNNRVGTIPADESRTATFSKPTLAPSSDDASGTLNLSTASSEQQAKLRSFSGNILEDIGKVTCPPPTTTSLNPYTVAQILLKNIQLLDTAIGDKDGKFSIQDLSKISNSNNSLIPKELKEAAFWLTQNPTAFNAFDVAGQANGTKKDGKISARDLQTYISNNKNTNYDEKPKEWTIQTVAETLLKYFDLLDAASSEKDGGITVKDLLAAKPQMGMIRVGFMRKNYGMPDDLTSAINALLGYKNQGDDVAFNPDLTVFNMFDSIASQKDGKITKKDLEKLLGKGGGHDGGGNAGPIIDAESAEEPKIAEPKNYASR